MPAFSESTLPIVAGLLLPVWKRLPNESTRVYRLQTDDGERIIGRRRGTGGTEGVAYLTETLQRRCFPELWSLRTKL